MVDFTEVEEEGWLSRIMESIKGVAAGLAMVVLAFPILFMNEGCAVKIAKGLEEGKGAVVSVSADKVDSANEGKLVHMTGDTKVSETLKDATFGVEASGVRLFRNVEMYQWVEVKKTKKKKKLGGKKKKVTTYEYKKEWKSSLVNSDNFKLAKNKKGERLINPANMRYESKDVMASAVAFGAFELNDALKQKMTKSKPLAAKKEWLAKLPKSDMARLNGENIYLGSNPDSPRVGDMRVSFSVVPVSVVSVVAKQAGNSFTPYVTKTDTQIQMLEQGKLTAAQMFKNAEDANVARTWIVRLIGFLMMAIGFGLVFKPLSVVADVVPFIGDIVGMGFAVVAGALAIPLSLITIGVAWVFYRPLVGIPLLLLGIGGLVGVKVLAAKKKAAAAPAPAA